MPLNLLYCTINFLCISYTWKTITWNTVYSRLCNLLTPSTLWRETWFEIVSVKKMGKLYHCLSFFSTMDLTDEGATSWALWVTIFKGFLPKIWNMNETGISKKKTFLHISYLQTKLEEENKEARPIVKMCCVVESLPCTC